MAVSPDTAKGNNGDVTIYVVGTGCDVSQWWTTATPSNAPVETWANYYVNGVLVSTTDAIDILPGETGTSVWNDGTGEGAAFNNGDVLCVGWHDIAGKPCETIEC
jgi:hypothetical protein